MKIQKVQQPVYNLTFGEDELRALKDIFGNMSDRCLKEVCGDAEHSKFVLEFYELLDNA